MPSINFSHGAWKVPTKFSYVTKSSDFYFYFFKICLLGFFFPWMPLLFKFFTSFFSPSLPSSLLHFLSNSLSCDFLIMLFCNVFLQCSRFVLCFFSSFRIVHDACSFTCNVLSCNFHHKFPMHLLMMLNMMFIVFYTLFHNAHNKSFKTFCFVL